MNRLLLAIYFVTSFSVCCAESIDPRIVLDQLIREQTNHKLLAQPGPAPRLLRAPEPAWGMDDPIVGESQRRPITKRSSQPAAPWVAFGEGDPSADDAEARHFSASGPSTVILKYEGALCYGTAVLAGKISEDMAQRFMAEIDAAKKKYTCADHRYLFVDVNTSGGAVSAAMKIGRKMRHERVTILLNRSSTCNSACVLLLAGASTRLVDGKVGIHRPYFNEASEKPLSQAEIKSAYTKMIEEIRSYLGEMNVTAMLAEDMLRIEPERVRYLTEAELDRYGLTLKDPIEAEIDDVFEARELGLDRSEFNRRKQYVDRRCRHPSSYGECRRQIMSSKP